MQRRHDDHRRASLQPPGRRWGFGANSVVPYLTQGRSMRGHEAEAVDQLINNPVFVHMEHTLRVLHGQH